MVRPRRSISPGYRRLAARSSSVMPDVNPAMVAEDGVEEDISQLRLQIQPLIHSPAPHRNRLGKSLA